MAGWIIHNLPYICCTKILFAHSFNTPFFNLEIPSCSYLIPAESPGIPSPDGHIAHLYVILAHSSNIVLPACPVCRPGAPGWLCRCIGSCHHLLSCCDIATCDVTTLALARTALCFPRLGTQNECPWLMWWGIIPYAMPARHLISLLKFQLHQCPELPLCGPPWQVCSFHGCKHYIL